MTEEERGAVDEVGLLRALADQAMQENGLADAQGAASVSIVPSTASVAAAGMDIGTPRYDAAVGGCWRRGHWSATKRSTGRAATPREGPGPSGSRAAGSTCCKGADSSSPEGKKTCGSYPVLEVLSGGETKGLAELLRQRRQRAGPTRTSRH